MEVSTGETVRSTQWGQHSEIDVISGIDLYWQIVTEEIKGDNESDLVEINIVLG